MNKSLQGKRILICEEALIDYKGHFYSWIKAIRKIHIDEGAEVLVACNKNVADTIEREFSAFPIYSRNNWSGIYDYKQAWKRYFYVLKHNFLIWKETKGLLRKIGHVDCVILTATRIHQLIAWRVLCRKGLEVNFNRLVIFILTSEAIYNDSFTEFHFKNTSKLIQTVIRSFKKLVSAGNVILAGDSHITCKEYSRLSGVEFRVLPSPAAGLTASSNIDVDNKKKDSSNTTFVILGVSVIDKGIDLLQQAIIILLEKDPSLTVRFIIQWANQITDYQGNIVNISSKLRSAPQVELIEKVLDEHSYKQYINKADFIILPYRLKVYFNRISGVAVEAATAGIPMIVTENSWLEWALNEFAAGVTFKDGDFEDLAKKVLMCIKDKQKLTETAQRRKALALEMNSSKHYLDCVWK